jgi:RNA polymerase sigma factor (sigma-70 family)
VATDRDLLLRALGGDSDSGAELIGRHLPSLMSWARPEILRRFDGRVDPDDVLQEFCAKLCDHRFRVLARWRGLTEPGEGSIEPYLHSVLANLILDEARRTYSRWSREDDWDDEVVAAVGDGRPGPGAIVAAEQLRAALWACIEQLSERRRDVVRLQVAGVPHEEIASRLGIEANASRARLHQAVRQLQQCLQATGHHELAFGSV